jgi:hypothetical protein
MDATAFYKKMDKWFNTRAGDKLQMEVVEYIKILDFCHLSQRFLQIGSCGQNLWLDAFGFQDTHVVSPIWTPYTDVLAQPHTLPFANRSMEVVFAPFLFESGLQIELLIHELDRVLQSMGLVIILGFTPIGLWKLSRYFKSKKNYDWYQMNPGHSYWSLRSAFRGIDYLQTDTKFFYYIPPFQKTTLISYFDWVDRFAKLIAPYPPSLFLLVMQKQEPQFITGHLAKSSFW